jgi:hypothetical protein
MRTTAHQVPVRVVLERQRHALILSLDYANRRRSIRTPGLHGSSDEGESQVARRQREVARCGTLVDH